MKMYGEPGNRQVRSWFLMRRTRDGLDADKGPQLPGPVNVVGSHFCGRERNRHAGNKLQASQKPAGRTAVAGAGDLISNRVGAEVVEKTDRFTLQGSVAGHVTEGAKVNIAEASAYNHVSLDHENFGRSLGECVDGTTDTTGQESFRALPERGYHGTFRHISPQRLNRYVREFTGKLNICGLDAIEQMTVLARGMIGKWLRRRELVGNAGAGQ